MISRKNVRSGRNRRLDASIKESKTTAKITPQEQNMLFKIFENYNQKILGYFETSETDETGITYPQFGIECDNSNAIDIDALQQRLLKLEDRYNIGFESEANYNGPYGRTYFLYHFPEGENSPRNTSACRKLNAAESRPFGDFDEARNGTVPEAQSVKDIVENANSGKDLADFIYLAFPRVDDVQVESQDENSIILNIISNFNSVGLVQVEFDFTSKAYRFQILKRETTDWNADIADIWDYLKHQVSKFRQ